MAQDTAAVFTTDDLALATTLLLSGHRHERFERISQDNGPGKVLFVYGDRTPFADLLDEYEMGDAVVEPGDFIRKLAYLRKKLLEFRDQ